MLVAKNLSWLMLLSLSVPLSSLVACGSKSNDAAASDDSGVGSDDDTGAIDSTPPPRHDSAPVDTGPEVDRGAPSDTYPAVKMELPQLSNNGGYVMGAPTIVTVTWPTDRNADKFEAFGDAIGASKYWEAITAEYGVGKAKSGPENHVRLTDAPPAEMDTGAAETFLVNALSDPKTKWPAPTDDTIYVLYVSASTKFIYNGEDACRVIGGYHTSTMVGDKRVAYAVIPPCKRYGLSAIDAATSAASHELGEAATDPFENAGFRGFDLPHASWELFQRFQTENGDACEFYQESYYKEDGDLPFAVQRQWSNKNALGGHDPCAPVPSGETYFNVTPLSLDNITVSLASGGGSSRTHTKGYLIPVGETRTVTLEFVSDRPMPEWTIDAVEGNPLLPPTADDAHLDLSVIAGTGVNGQKAYLTIKVNSAGRTKAELVTVVSSSPGGLSHYMPILIGSM